jgi:hypothetical protein
MFLKLGLDLSHGSMAAMKHLLLIYLPEATVSYLLATVCFICVHVFLIQLYLCLLSVDLLGLLSSSHYTYVFTLLLILMFPTVHQ